MSSQTAPMRENLSYEAVKQLFRDAETPVLTAQDIAEAFGITRQAAKYRLDRLYDRGEIKRMDVGSSAVVWWLADDYSDSDSK